MCELQTDKEEGRAAVVYGKYELLENKWWGIEGGGEVEVMWVYLEYAEEFVEQLPADTQVCVWLFVVVFLLLLLTQK